MKQTLVKFQLLFLSLLASFTLTAQQVATTTQVFTTPDFGSTVNVPINSTDITSSYGNIAIATIRIEYDPAVLTYVGIANVNAAVAGFTRTVNPAGVSGVVQVNMEDPNFWTTFTGIAWPDGKAFDIQFTYKGGATVLTLTKAEFLDASFNTDNAPVVNGGVSGYTTLTGSNGDWNTASTWTGYMGTNTQPVAWHDVTVQSGGEIVISADATCHNLTIASGGRLTLNSGKTLTVTGNFEMASGGSFIKNGPMAVTGTTVVKQFISAANWSNQYDGWHLLSSPVTSQAISGGFTPSGAGNDYDLYAWSEPTQLWLNQKTPANGLTTFQPGKGYLVAYQQAGTKEFSGTLNNSDVAFAATQSGTPNALNSYGFNLAGNPFPSAISYNNGSWGMTNFAPNSSYIWSDVTKGYVLLNALDPIPAMNGFMVLVGSPGGTLTIPHSACTHSATAWHKSALSQIRLVAYDPQGESSQESMIRFDGNATSGFDFEYDALSLSGFGPKFYSVADGDHLTLNTIPSPNTNQVIPFGFEKNSSTNFTINLEQSVEGAHLSLRDKKTNTVVNLDQNPVYSFTAADGDDVNRFELILGINVGIDENPVLASAYVYNKDNSLVVNNVTGDTQMDLYTVQGQLLKNFRFNSTGTHEISVSLPTGIYMVRLINGGAMKTMKVLVN
jgi:autotransporter passenger strand-loop-strand repeat protein